MNNEAKREIIRNKNFLKNKRNNNQTTTKISLIETKKIKIINNSKDKKKNVIYQRENNKIKMDCGEITKKNREKNIINNFSKTQLIIFYN